MDNKPVYITANGSAYTLLKSEAKHMRAYPTVAESMLWQAIRGKQLGVKFRRQHIIENYIVDFVCLEKQLVLEIDGKYHLDKHQQGYDQMRTTHLEADGFRVLRFSNEEITHNIENVITTIKEQTLS